MYFLHKNKIIDNFLIYLHLVQDDKYLNFHFQVEINTIRCNLIFDYNEEDLMDEIMIHLHENKINLQVENFVATWDTLLDRTSWYGYFVDNIRFLNNFIIKRICFEKFCLLIMFSLIDWKLVRFFNSKYTLISLFGSVLLMNLDPKSRIPWP